MKTQRQICGARGAGVPRRGAIQKCLAKVTLCRLEIGDTADWKSALRRLWSLGIGNSLVIASLVIGHLPAALAAQTGERHLLYVAEPGIRNYLEYGGHGVLVYDIDHGHQFVKRIKAAGLDE